MPMRSASEPATGQGVLATMLCRRQRGLRRAFRLVAVSSRNAEHGEHVAADASIGATAELGDRFVHATLKLRREHVRFFRIELRFEFQQAFEARHEDRRIDAAAAAARRARRGSVARGI